MRLLKNNIIVILLSIFLSYGVKLSNNIYAQTGTLQKSPAWQECSPLPEKTSAACGVINKKIYAVTGCPGDFKNPGYIYEYDPGNNTWKKKADMPVIKRGFQCFVFHNKLYTIGGISDTAGTRSNTLEEYDPVENKWKQKASMKVGREGIGIVEYNNKIYALGGFKAKNDEDTDIEEVYNPETDSWILKKPMPTGRAWSSTFLLNNKIYVVGGFGNGKWQTTVEEYDPENDSWTKKKPVPHNGAVSLAATVNGDIYTVCYNFRADSSYTDKYNPLTDTWTSLAVPPQNSFDFAKVVSGSNIFVISGFYRNTSNVLKTVLRYNVLQNKWEKLPDLNYGRVSMGTGIIDNIIYVIGGQFGWYTNPIKYTDAVEKLDVTCFSESKNNQTERNDIKQSESKLIWKTKKNAPEKKGFCPAVFNNLIYSVTADSPNVYLYLYNPTSDSWSDRILLKSKRYEVWSLRELNGKLYHYNGMENGERSTSVEEYDPVSKTSRLITDAKENEKLRKTLTFDFTANLPGTNNRWIWGPYTINNKRYLLHTEPWDFKFVSVYEEDLKNNSWVKKKDMYLPRVDASIVVANNKIYAFGGWLVSDGKRIVSDIIEVYDPAPNTWKIIGKMPQPRWGMGLAFVNKKFYLIGGNDKDWKRIDLVEELEIIP